MSLIIKEAKYRLPFLLLSAVSFLICWKINESYDNMEISFFVIPIVLCGLLFFSNDEIELIKITNTRISTVLIIRYTLTFIYMVLPADIILLISDVKDPAKSVISLTTTLLFSTAFSLLYRVLCKNPYATVIYSMLTHSIFIFTFKSFLVHFVHEPKELQRYSPFYSTSISNMGVYTNNRMLFTGIGLFIILASYLILRYKEKFFVE